MAATTRARYNYAEDNPLNAGDPTGLGFFKDVGEGIAAWGDVFTLGATKWACEQLGNDNVNTCSTAYQIGGYAGLATAMLIPGQGEAALGTEGITTGAKIVRQMEARGWTEKTVQEAIKSGEQVRAVNKATGNPATRYISPTTGQSVVVDDVTRKVINVGGPGFNYGQQAVICREWPDGGFCQPAG